MIEVRNLYKSFEDKDVLQDISTVFEDGKTNQAYHRADYMEERREMLQAWADYLDSITEQKDQQAGDKAA